MATVYCQVNNTLYYLLLNNQQAGPYTAGQLRAMWQNGVTNAQTQYCFAGGTSWQPLINLRTMLETAPAQSTPPSPPPPRPSLLDQGGNYNIPIRVERQSQSSGGSAGGGFNSSSMGIAFKGSVCPSCMSANYIQTYSVWHGILAICFFPIGLIGFAFPIKKCVQCHSQYGAGLQMTRVLGMISIVIFVIVVLALIASSGR
jgi:hypothetical protein